MSTKPDTERGTELKVTIISPRQYHHSSRPLLVDLVEYGLGITGAEISNFTGTE